MRKKPNEGDIVKQNQFKKWFQIKTCQRKRIDNKKIGIKFDRKKKGGWNRKTKSI
jgi:hypothetical protein